MINLGSGSGQAQKVAEYGSVACLVFMYGTYVNKLYMSDPAMDPEPG
jgi:hypothetical protein